MGKNKVNSLRTPIYRDAGFVLHDASTTSRAFADETLNKREPGMYIYSRYRNPTVVSAEEQIMHLEESGWTLLSESGMSAIDIALSIFQNGKKIRPWLFFSEIYGGTISYAESVLRKRRGHDIQYFAPTGDRYDTGAFEKMVKSLKPGIVYIESISNPMLIVPDAESIIMAGKKHGAKIIVDNTFATPYLWKPLKCGADIVIHSATKYFSGHGNLTAGALCGNDRKLMKAAIEYRKYCGHMLSADDAYRLHTQVQTFSLRFSRQCENAAAAAALLNSDRFVKKVWYPGLETHPSHREAIKLFGKKGFGGMVTFDFAGRTAEDKRKKRDTFIRSVSDSIRLIPTLGDPHSILMPVESVWGAKYHEPGMIRLSAGFENTEELLDHLKKGLNSVK